MTTKTDCTGHVAASGAGTGGRRLKGTNLP